ncbi:hypothetical protein APSETT445_006024 [Aspergillus pseudonomiae]
MNVLAWRNNARRVTSLTTRNTVLRAKSFVRTMSQFRVVEHTVRAQHIRDRFGATEPGQANKLRLAVKQYIPKSNEKPSPGDVTIIGAHANGFPKALVLIDPVIQTENPSKDYAPPSSYRRDIWATKQDAIQRFQNNKVYQKWEPRVLEKYVEYGLREVPTEIYPEPTELGSQPVTLTTPKAQEVFTFLRPTYEGGRVDVEQGEWQNEMHPDDFEESYPFYRPEPAQLFRRLGEMKPSVLYIFGESSELSSPAARQAKMDVTGTGVGGNGGVSRQRVKEVTLPTGHLVPMERVMDCANAIATFSDAELSRWDAERQTYLQRWSAIPRRDKITVDDKWKQHIGRLSRKPKL